MAHLAFDERFLAHRAGHGHPECPDRLRAIMVHLRDARILAKLRPVPHRAASRGEVQYVHSPRHYNLVETTCAAGGAFDPDTAAVPASFEASVRAAGAVIAAADAVMAGPDRRALCLVRPPGHHATPDQVMGFCLFNNIAIGAEHFRRAHGLNRIAIIDFDVHHGNGTEAAFANDPDVFFLSLHRWPFFPGTGGPGSGDAVATLNVPLPPDTSPAAYHRAFDAALREVEDHRPEAVLVSAGFDAHRDDPIGGLNLTAGDFGRLTEKIVAMAERTAGGRVVTTLEGGYNLSALGPCVEAHLRALDPGL